MFIRIITMLVAALLLTGAAVAPISVADNLQLDAATTEILPAHLVEEEYIVEERIAEAPIAEESTVEAELVLLTADEAKAIALKHAGVSADQTKGLKAELDKKDKEYDIEFRSGDYEYDYEIHAESGKIISSDKEKDD